MVHSAPGEPSRRTRRDHRRPRQSIQPRAGRTRSEQSALPVDPRPRVCTRFTTTNPAPYEIRQRSTTRLVEPGQLGCRRARWRRLRGACSISRWTRTWQPGCKVDSSMYQTRHDAADAKSEPLLFPICRTACRHSRCSSFLSRRISCPLQTTNCSQPACCMGSVELYEHATAG